MPAKPWLTHGLLAAMLLGYYALLIWAPLWLAFVPGVLLAHRIGIMGHEYIHACEVLGENALRHFRDREAVIDHQDFLGHELKRVVGNLFG
jgi:hypothetical protein